MINHGKYNNGNQFRFKNSMLRLSLYDYSEAHMLVKTTVIVRNIAAQDQVNDAANKN